MLLKIIIFKKILISALLFSVSILALLGSFRYVWGIRQLDSSSGLWRFAQCDLGQMVIFGNINY